MNEMQNNDIHRNIPGSIILLLSGIVILLITLFIGGTTENWGVILTLYIGLYASIILIGVGAVLGVLNLLDARSKP